jgi:hypothetical protein
VWAVLATLSSWNTTEEDVDQSIAAIRASTPR